MRTLKYREWKERYRPIVAAGQEGNPGFSQYWFGERREMPPGTVNGQIWTVKDGSGSSIYLTNGLGIVDVLGYVVCEKSWRTGEEFVVDL